MDGPPSGPASESSITSVYPGFFYCVQESPAFFYKLYNYFFSERFEKKEWTSWTHREKAGTTYIIEKSEGGPKVGQRWTGPTFYKKKHQKHKKSLHIENKQVYTVDMMQTNKGDNIMTIYTWNTKKNQNNTYSYIVKKVISTDEIQEDGTYTITTIEKIGACKTRAKAKTKGIQWARYFKSQEQA